MSDTTNPEDDRATRWEQALPQARDATIRAAMALTALAEWIAGRCAGANRRLPSLRLTGVDVGRSHLPAAGAARADLWASISGHQMYAQAARSVGAAAMNRPVEGVHPDEAETVSRAFGPNDAGGEEMRRWAEEARERQREWDDGR